MTEKGDRHLTLPTPLVVHYSSPRATLPQHPRDNPIVQTTSPGSLCPSPGHRISPSQHKPGQKSDTHSPPHSFPSKGKCAEWSWVARGVPGERGVKQGVLVGLPWGVWIERVPFSAAVAEWVEWLVAVVRALLWESNGRQRSPKTIVKCSVQGPGPCFEQRKALWPHTFTCLPSLCHHLQVRENTLPPPAPAQALPWPCTGDAQGWGTHFQLSSSPNCNRKVTQLPKPHSADGRKGLGVSVPDACSIPYLRRLVRLASPSSSITCLFIREI